MSRIKRIPAAVLLAASMSLCACKGSVQEERLYSEELMTPEQANYETVQAVNGEYVKTISGSLSIYYPNTAELFWEEDNARFREVLVKKGQEVKKGDVLAVFDIEVSEVDKEELTLKITRATEDLRTGKQERQSAINDAQKEAESLEGHERQIALLKVEKLQAEYEEFVYRSELEIAGYRERMEELEAVTANNTLLAPFDGVIDTVVSFEPGDRVEAKKVLITMHATDTFYLAASDSGNLRYHMEVTVESGNKDNKKSYTGRVVTAYNVLPSSLSQKTLIKLDGDVSAAELSESLKFQGNLEELQNVLLTDRSAVSHENKKEYVYVLKDDMIQKRYIVSGLSNTDFVWVLDGLSEGQSLIVD